MKQWNDDGTSLKQNKFKWQKGNQFGIIFASKKRRYRRWWSIVTCVQPASCCLNSWKLRRNTVSRPVPKSPTLVTKNQTSISQYLLNPRDYRTRKFEMNARELSLRQPPKVRTSLFTSCSRRIAAIVFNFLFIFQLCGKCYLLTHCVIVNDVLLSL